MHEPCKIIGMSLSIQRTLDAASKYLSWVPLLFGCGVVTALGTISAWLTLHTKWLISYGPAAWWFAALLGVLIGTAFMVGFAFARYQWIKGSAIRNWGERVSSINPMDSEFHKLRISISDIVSPITGMVENKRFIDCELGCGLIEASM